ncbi:gamma-glutamylcyclotransferase [Motiliproteus sediminis]|uniref:gamma-glutamylcyclotransferase n=1 Tax=Motiliproteus sediminis TaxID=1468178 RepID=UPI001AEF49F5|nr:gamma-glutamylcyclotransferase [Motiliproteus sediminis]
MQTTLTPHPDTERPSLPPGPLWVFAYGSLLWRPEFEYQQRLPARLFGYHRSLCVWSHVHRGTPQQPGMVLGLDRGGSCCGCLYQVDADHKHAVAEYLYAREMPTRIYRARIHPVYPAGQPAVAALTFVVDRRDRQYVGALSPDEAAHHVAAARGMSGSSRDYLLHTLEHLQHLGLRDRHLEAIAAALPRCDLRQRDSGQ